MALEFKSEIVHDMHDKLGLDPDKYRIRKMTYRGEERIVVVPIEIKPYSVRWG
jgi:hypothetical protein